MKKVLLTGVLLSAFFLTSCEKDEPIMPTDRTLLNADKGILCRGCADWDIVEPDPEASAMRVESPTSDSTAIPKSPTKPGNKRR